MPFRDLRLSFVFTFFALALSFALGLHEGGVAAAGEAMFTTAVLALLEISLSVDNAIVNASVLRKMSPLWQRRFLFWGILTSVFAMRLLFPVCVVSVVGWISPFQALRLALLEPDRYAEMMLSSHLRLIGFGAAFLFMVFIYYFFNREKSEHWLGPVERVFVRLDRIPLFKAMLFVAVFLSVSLTLPLIEQAPFLMAAVCGLGTFLLIHAFTLCLNVPQGSAPTSARGNLYLFIYLEILDASFSFDGVIGGFALTHNLIILTLGLGVGAMYVRGLTMWLVRQNTLAEFRYLEHGAFYAIGALALLMLVDLRVPVPDAVNGGVGLFILGLSVWSSLRKRRTQVKAAVEVQNA